MSLTSPKPLITPNDSEVARSVRNEPREAPRKARNRLPDARSAKVQEQGRDRNPEPGSRKQEAGAGHRRNLSRAGA